MLFQVAKCRKFETANIKAQGLLKNRIGIAEKLIVWRVVGKVLRDLNGYIYKALFPMRRLFPDENCNILTERKHIT